MFRKSFIRVSCLLVVMLVLTGCAASATKQGFATNLLAINQDVEKQQAMVSNVMNDKDPKLDAEIGILESILHSLNDDRRSASIVVAPSGSASIKEKYLRKLDIYISAVTKIKNIYVRMRDAANKFDTLSVGMASNDLISLVDEYNGDIADLGTVSIELQNLKGSSLMKSWTGWGCFRSPRIRISSGGKNVLPTVRQSHPWHIKASAHPGPPCPRLVFSSVH